MPVATVITSPKGVTAIAHGNKPMSEEAKAALGEVIDKAVEALRKPGRPKTGFDKAAYNREYMRKRRAAKAAK